MSLLEPHQSFKREISPGEMHAYRIALDSGKYVRVMVEHLGLELSVAFFGPGGQGVVEYKCRPDEPTPISLVADVSGMYRLEVRAADRDSISGRYEVKIEELRPATTRDRGRIAAEKAFAEAVQLRAEFRVESNRRAIEKYEEAREYWRSAGDRREEANALKNIGEVYQLLGATETSFTFYQKALTLSRQINDLRGEGAALNDIGYLHFSLGDNQKALENSTRALKLSRLAGDRQGEARALNSIGEAHYGSDNLHQALEFQQEALQLWRTLNDRRGQARTLTLEGYAYEASSETQKAFDFYRQALDLWRGVSDQRGLAQTLTAVSFLHSKVGETQEALDSYTQALQLAQSMGDRNMEAPLLGGLGYTYAKLGEKQKALSYYNQALALYQAMHDRWGEAAVQLTIGMIYHSLGENQNALNFYQQALLTFRALDKPRTESQVLREIGLAYDSLDEETKSLDYYKQSLSLTRAVGDRREEAYTLNYIGRVYERLGRTQEALDYYSQALPLSRLAGDRYGESSTLYNIARAERDHGKLEEACARIEAALRIIESLRTNVISQDLRASYFASVLQHYELYVDLLMRRHGQDPSRGFDAAAFEASERARARSMLETLAEAHADIRQGVDPVLLERERLLQQTLDTRAERQMRLLSGKHTEEEAAAVATEIDDITTEYDEVKERIRAASPRYAALTQPQPLGLKEIQRQVLDDNTLLLEYALGDERSYLWAVTGNSINGYELPKRALIEEAARRVYDLLKAHQPVPGETLAQRQARGAAADGQYWQEAERLSRMILGPVAGQLQGRRLLIVADGALQYIPFGALTTPATVSQNNTSALAQEAERVREPSPLIIDHEIVNLPSASTLAVLRQETARRAPAPRAVAILADPVFEKDDPRIAARFREQAPAQTEQATTQTEAAELHQAVRDAGGLDDGGSIPRLLASRDEAEAIMQFTPGGAGLKAIGFDASRATATSPELSKYRIVHFATHGLLNSEHPELSGVILSLVDQQGQSQNGFLRLHDIYNLKLPADLVVLSACNTGLGKDVKGEGLIGLTRGFMYAGASSVMASLWKVDDEATAELMKQFYRGMLKDGLPPAAALRQAQIMMWKQKPRRAPYYWAAFVLQGEYRERIEMHDVAGARTGRIMAAGAMVLVFSIGGGLYARQRRRRNAMQTSAL